jgi:hypothetical protein
MHIHQAAILEQSSSTTADVTLAFRPNHLRFLKETFSNVATQRAMQEATIMELEKEVKAVAAAVGSPDPAC